MRSSSTGGGIEFRKAVRINAPVEDVFAFWQNYDNFPRFMSHLKEVRDMGDGRSHWVANGPADVPVEWDAQITEMRPNRVIAWESLPGSEVYNAGRVRFESVDGRDPRRRLHDLQPARRRGRSCDRRALRGRSEVGHGR